VSIAFYLTTECNTCGRDMFYGLNISALDEHLGYPVIGVDMASQVKFECDHCGGVTYTGDFDDMCEHEEGEIPEDEDDEDEEAS
jgi:hypothetical protein